MAGEQSVLAACRSRAVAMEELRHLVAGPDGRACPMTLLLFDVDHFAAFNAEQGVDCGDRMLGLIAACLASRGERSGDPARLGDDEFALLVELGPGSLPIEALAEACLADLAATRDPEFGRLLPCSLGVGVIAPNEDGYRLLRRANQALRHAKAARGSYVIVSSDETVVASASLVQDLRRAIANDVIEPHFQPIVDLKSRRNVGFEMFARWNDPHHGSVAPALFIKLAETHGLLSALTASLMRRACAFAATWPSRFTLAVNISLAQLADPDLPDMIARLLAESGLAPERLELEIPEAALLPENEVQARIGDLARIGLKLALDDFGGSFAALRSLRRLPIDKLKIHPSFVNAAACHGEGLDIFKGIVVLGQSLGIQMVAEGVETEAALQIAELAGCTMAQGWHFARAIPAPPDADGLSRQRSAGQ